jgi:hypothetical protein
MSSEFSDNDFHDFFKEHTRRLEEQTNRIAQQIRGVNVNLTAEDITQELLDIAQVSINNDDAENVYFILDERGEYVPDPLVVNYGWQLAKLGYPDIGLMQEVFYSVRPIFGNNPHFSNLSHAWHGVGFWQD